MAIKITQQTVTKAKVKPKPYEIVGQHGLTLRVQPTGRKIYYVRYGRNGRRRLGPADVLTLKRAEYLAREQLNEAHDFGDPLRRDLRKATVGGFIQHDYTQWLGANRRNADKTLADLRRNFEKQLYQKRLVDISRKDLDTYVAEGRDAGRSAATIVRSLNNLRAVLRLALDRGYIRDNPFRGWQKPKVQDNGITRYLSVEEETDLRSELAERDDKLRQERIRGNEFRKSRGYDLLPEFSEKQFGDHLTPMVLTSLNSGLRYGELTGLEWSAVDFKAKVLTVTGQTAKGQKSRHIPMNAEAVDVLARWKAQCEGKGLVFRNPVGEKIGTVKTAWGAILKAAKIENFRWHDLRHSFASRLVQKGVDLAVVRDLLGHGDFSLTLRYAHLDAKQKQDAVARLAI